VAIQYGRSAQLGNPNERTTLVSEKKPKSIDDILGLMPLPNMAESHDMEMTHTFYTLAHDVIHWVAASDEAFRLFYYDMCENFLAYGQEAPSEEIIRHNVMMIHTMASTIVSALDEMLGKDSGDDSSL
jgi:hypothetical protein